MTYLLHLTCLDENKIKIFLSALEEQNQAILQQIIYQLYPSEIADIIEQLNEQQRQALINLIDVDLSPEVYSYLHSEVRQSILALLTPKRIAHILDSLESDDAVDLLEDLEEDLQQKILKYLPNHERLLYEQTLGYPEDSAGRLMRREAALIPYYWTVGQAIDHLRKGENTVPNDFYSLIVVGRDHHPAGVIPLSRLIKNRRQMPVVRLMDSRLHSVSADTDQEKISKIFRQYGLSELPVVDTSNRLIGVITLDDILEVIDEEGEQDMLALGGINHDDFFDDLLNTLLSRIPWLLVNLLTAFLASLVIFNFENILDKVVALAVLMPITASMGGNAGTQTLTVVIRALATDQLTSRNALHAISKETMVGFMNGFIFALIIGLITSLWYQDLYLGSAIAIAMIIAMVTAGMAGVLIPLALSCTRFDPAISSSVFLTTVTDIIGFSAFLFLAEWALL